MPNDDAATEAAFMRLFNRTAVGVGSVLLAVGAVLATGEVREWSRARGSLSWPQGAATVSSSELVYDSYNRKHRVEIRLRYIVDSQSHLGGSYALYPRIGHGAKQIVEAHPTGSTVTVSYDPEEPSTAVIRTGPKKGKLLGAILYLGVAVAGALALWLGVASMRRSHAKKASE